MPCVGRVLDVRNDGENLAVTLGPVTLTDIIRQCGTSGGIGYLMPKPVTDAITSFSVSFTSTTGATAQAVSTVNR